MKTKLNEMLTSFKRGIAGAPKNAVRILKVSGAEDRKMFHVPSFWALTIIMVLISIGAVIYENAILPDRVNPDSFAEEATYISDEWIQSLEMSVRANEASLNENNMSDVARERLQVTLKNSQRQLEMLRYLQENNVPVYLKETGSYDVDYAYFLRGYAYRFGEINFTVGFGELGESYAIYSDEAAGDSIFEMNLIFYFVAVLLVVIAFSDEYSSGSIKLVVTRPMGRGSIGGAKLLSIYTLLTVSWAISAVVYALLSVCFKSPVSYFAYIGGTLNTISVTAFNMLVFLDILFVSFGFVAVSAFFAVRFKNNIVAVILPFIVFFFKSVFVRVIGNLQTIDLFENLRLMEHFVLGNAAYGSIRVWQALLSSVGIAAVLIFFAIRKFKKYDMEKIK